jgi:hypothetical protein
MRLEFEKQYDDYLTYTEMKDCVTNNKPFKVYHEEMFAICIPEKDVVFITYYNRDGEEHSIFDVEEGMLKIKEVLEVQ